MFTATIRGGKPFTAPQKIRELKSRIAKIKAISDKSKAKILLTTIIKQSTQSMNDIKSEKYCLSPNDIGKKPLSSERFKTLFNIEMIKRSEKIWDRFDKYDQIKYSIKKKRLREELHVGAKVLILARRIRKKSALGKFYKQTAQNTSYFNNENVFTIRN